MDKRVKIFLILFVVITVGLILYYYYEEKEYRYGDEKEKDKYLSSIIYEVPSSFEKDNNYAGYNYNYYKLYNHCSFEVKYFDNYNNYENGEEYLKDNYFPIIEV